jgi:hypothetical protein
MVRCALAGVVLGVVLTGAGPVGAVTKADERSLGERLPAQRLAQLCRGSGEESKPASEGKFHITDETEVQLDGRPCKYADVPSDAVVVLVELAADGKTVLKAHFRSRK